MIRRTIRPSTDASTARIVGKTLAQTALFWGFFLWLLPWIIIRFTSDWPLPDLRFPGHTATGWVVFGVAGTIGITSGMVMSVRGRGTPIPMDCARELVVVGPYRWVRNPMALAGITQGVAIGIVHGSLLVIMYALAGAGFWHLVVRPPEEADLADRFGLDFDSYRRDVRCWLPRRRPWSPD
ncbi:MAG: isoprenylcysteine carboxylmethyltransferase family protein [Phycisphaerales bacterium]